MKRAICLLVTAVALCLPSMSFADGGLFGGHKEKCQGKNRPGDLMACVVCFKASFYLNNSKELGLTKDQQEKIRSIDLEFNKKRVHEEADIESTMMDLLSELHQDNPDKAKLDSFVDKKFDLKKGLEKEAIQAVLDMRNTLTPEQKDKAQSLFQEHKKGGGFGHKEKACNVCGASK